MKIYSNPIEDLIHTTVMLTCTTERGISTGTGFFYKFEKEARSFYCIVTNVHVIEEATIGEISLTLSLNNKPVHGQKTTITIDNFENRWIKHPSVDLAIFDFTPFLKNPKIVRKKPYFKSLSKVHLAKNNPSIMKIASMEDIIMIGYPNGIRDDVNNLPVIRRGITATNPMLPYNGRPEFLIDAACYPGSSGSPVLIANIGSFLNDEGLLCSGNRIALVGILYAGFQHTTEGNIKVTPVPTKVINIIESSIPNNLGIVIDANKLLDFPNLI